MNTLTEALPSLAILIVAVLTLRYLRRRAGRRRKGPGGGARTVLIILTLLLSGAATLAVVHYAVTPTYTAHTQLFVAANQGAFNNDAAISNQFSQDRVASYAELVASPELAKRVIGTLALPETPENLAGRVTARAVPDTVLIDVSVTASATRAAATAGPTCQTNGNVIMSVNTRQAAIEPAATPNSTVASPSRRYSSA